MGTLPDREADNEARDEDDEALLTRDSFTPAVAGMGDVLFFALVLLVTADLGTLFVAFLPERPLRPD